MTIFSESDKKRLQSNPSIKKVTDNHIVFTSKFKLKAVELNLDGHFPVNIFKQFKIDISLLRQEYPAKCLERWKKLYLEKGKTAFETETRGKKSKGRPKKEFDPTDKESLLKKLAYLEAENDFLKKLHALADVTEKKNSR